MKYPRSIISVLLAVVMLFGSVPTIAFAKDENRLEFTEIETAVDPRSPELFVSESDEKSDEPEYSPDDTVRVSIIMDSDSAIDKGYPIETIGSNKAAANYQDKLCREQDKVVDRIEEKVLDGEELDVVTNLTLVANLVSADVEYSQIEDIENVKGVKEVVIENVYEPLEDEQTVGEKAAAVEKALTEYRGAGSRIAIIDSGVNDEHQSFDADALNYSLRQSAPDTDNNGSVDDEELAEYKESLDFMTQEDVSDAIDTTRLHVLQEHQDADKLYINDKIPFAYNYSDYSHFTKNGAAGIHGSHVSGIAAANAYVPVQNDGEEKTFEKAENANAMVGTAPDAQILNLKVFGSNLCTDAVIATAIEDALILGADVLNLSLGTAEVGFSCADSVFGGVFDELTKQGVLIMGAVGNDGAWMSENKKGRPNKLYSDDVNMSLCTPPSSYADFMGVAWADGDGKDGSHPTINKSSAYGIPSSLMLQPEITAFGTKVNSVDGNTNSGYTMLSGTSMAAPDVTGAAAVVSQYIKAEQAQFGNDSFLNRALAQNESLNKGMISAGLLMSTADPMIDPSGKYYSLLRQGAGLLNTQNAASAKSFIEIDGQTRGRVKAEVGDCPDGTNTFHYTFTLHNVSETDRNYYFKTDLFTEDTVTEDGIDYLADNTRDLLGKATYKIGGKEIDFDSKTEADINRDNKTDADDALALLDYLSGKIDGNGLNLDVADVDGDGKKTTYDAHLILSGLKTSAVCVKADGSVTVDVDIEVTDSLDKYPKGAYLEGFTSVVPVNMGEEETDVTHTIPILGFCGNWSDPSMFDRNSFVESFSGTNSRVPYTQSPSGVYDINYMTYQDEGGNLLKQAVNLYDENSRVPLDKLALSLNDTIRSIQLTLIRPAGAMCFAIMTKDKDGNRHVESIDAVYIHQTCAFPSPNSVGGWSGTSVSLPVRATLKKLLKGTNVKEGDKIELGAVAVPEYYEETPGKTINAARIKKLIEDGALGEGAYLTTTVTLDSDAPKVENVEKTGSSIRVTATDAQSVAFIGLYSGNGTYSFEKRVLGENDAKSDIVAEFSSSRLQEGGTYNIVVGDYAGNRSTYRFTFGEKQDISDKVIANIRSSSNGGAQINRGDWIAVDPGRFSLSSGRYTNGFVFSSADASALLAGADAADGYLWQAFEDGSLRVAPLSDVNAKQLVCDLSAFGVKTVRDLAFNPKDHMLYAADGSDTLWQIDPMLGEVKAAQKVEVDGKPAALYGLTVNNEGKAVATHYDKSTEKSILVSWTIAGGEETVTADKCTIGHKELSTMRYISLTWKDPSRTVLYAACAENLDRSSYKNYLYEISSINFENGTSVAYQSASGWDANLSRFNEAVRGLVNLAVMPKLGLVKDGEPAALNILGAKREMVAGDTLQLTAAISPWNAQSTASSVQWRADGDAVSVDGSGLVTAIKAGKATVTATLETGGEPLTAECEIEVKPAPDIDVTAVFCEGNGSYYWENFSTATPNERKRLAFSNAYTAGTMNRGEDCLYLFSGSWAYRVDPQTFKTDPLVASIDASHKHADAAPGMSRGFYTNFGYFTVESNGQVLLLGSRLGREQEDCFDTVTVSFHTGRVSVGALAGITYKGLVEVEDFCNYGTKNPELTGQKYKADAYYVINESGDLFELYCYEAPRWYAGVKDEPGEWIDSEQVYEKKIGHVDGVSLPGVSQMTNYATSSMIYDAASELLVLVSKIGNGAAKVQVIDPKTASLIMTREFDDDVRQVGVLYQYDYSKYSDITQKTESSASDMGAYASQNAANESFEVNKEEKTVTFNLTADETTNGLMGFKYDPSVLTFSKLTASMPYSSYSNNAEDGTINIAFADADTIENPTVKIEFTYEEKENKQTAELTVTERENGDPKTYSGPNEQKESVTLPAKEPERTLQSIEISAMPKTEYLEGDANLDTNGLEVTAHYSDGSEKTLNAGDCEISGYQSTPGEHKITVSYTEDGVTQTAEFTVSVKAKSPVSLTVSKRPDKTVYVEGTEFDGKGMELTVTYDNGDIEPVTDGWETEYNFDKAGKSTVTVSYAGLQTTLEVDVVEKSPVSLTVSKQPDKTVYVEGTDFDGKGMELTLTYDNGDTETITDGWETEYNFDKAGKSTVTVSYAGLQTTLEVDVVEKSLTGIKISSAPEQSVYLEDSGKLNLSGGKLTLYYDNGTTEEIEISSEMISKGFDITKPGKQTVTVEYGGFTAEFEVTVQPKEIERIEITRNPNKTDYIEGTQFDPQGMEITVYYNNGKTEILTDGFEIEYDFGSAGESSVIVSYQGYDAALKINVAAKTLTRIEVTHMPNVTEYALNSEIDDSGMELTLYFDNGTTQTVTEGWTTQYDFSVAGQREVKVSYNGLETVFLVDITDDAAEEPQKPTESQTENESTENESTENGNTNTGSDKSPETSFENESAYIVFVLILSCAALLMIITVLKKRYLSK